MHVQTKSLQKASKLKRETEQKSCMPGRPIFEKRRSRVLIDGESQCVIAIWMLIYGEIEFFQHGAYNKVNIALAQ